MLVKLLKYPYSRKKLNRASEGGSLYQILVEKDAEFKPSQYNNLFDSLYTMYEPNNPYKWASFEFWGTHRGIHLYSWTSAGVPQDFLQANINSVHPCAEIVPVDKASDYARFGRLFNKDTACASLELDSHYIFNLQQSDGERVGADLMASLCASMQNLDDEEEVAVQFLLRPVHYRSLAIANAYYEIYKKVGSRPSKLHYPYTQYTPYVAAPKALLGALKFAAVGSAGKTEHNTSMTSLQKKLEAGIYFDLSIRVICSHSVFGKARARLSTVISSFAPATDKNRLRPYSNFNEKTYFKHFKVQEITKFLKAYAARRVHTYPVENYVAPSELATLIHFPSKHIPGVIRLRAKKLPVPDGIIQYNSITEAWKDGAIVFGKSNFRGRTKYLAFKDIRMLMQHTYCIGGTGSGKSYWLTFLALQVIRHAGLTFFDVKGDVVDELIRYIPKSEWHRIVYIDLHDAGQFLPLNILRQPGVSVYNLATMIVGVFVKVFSEGSIKEHSQNILRKALIAVISTDKEGSLLEIYRMFTDEAYLDKTVATMEAGTEYPDVLAYWKNIYKRMKPSARKTEAGAILNKLETITQNERPRYTLCQRGNSMNWRKLMDEKAIVLVNLSMGQNEEQILDFFGTIFTSFISKAAFSRDDIRESERVPHVFILDEFERFVQLEGDMKKFLEMSRSYGLGMVLSHQSVEQIKSNSLMGMIEDNTFTQISLLIGTGSEKRISRMFPGVDGEDLISMEQYTGYARFKKLHPNPFTFDSVDFQNESRQEHFGSVSWEDVQNWKNFYKRKNYRRMAEVKGDIDRRYRLVEQNQLTDEDGATVKKGKASGRISKGVVVPIGKEYHKPQGK